MIPHTLLLPKLTADEQQAIDLLVADYSAAVALIKAHDDDGRKAKKRELRAKLSTAKADKLMSIGAELEILNEACAAALKSAKGQMRALKSRYVALFGPLLLRSDARANELIADATREYKKHFAPFKMEPVGISPVVAFLLGWKQALGTKRESYEVACGILPHPSDILPYQTSTDKAEVLK